MIVNHKCEGTNRPIRCRTRSWIEPFKTNNSLIDVNLLHLRSLATDQGLESPSILELKNGKFQSILSSNGKDSLKIGIR